MRFFVLGCIALGWASTASANPCDAVLAKIGQLSVHERALRSPDTRPNKLAKHEAGAKELRGWLDAHAKSCGWVQRAARNKWLSPYADAAGRVSEAALAKAMVRLELGLRGLLPDDPACIAVTRATRPSRKGTRCFDAQKKGATANNLKTVVKGWCRGRKRSTTSQSFGIETNDIARLLEAPGMPGGFAERVLDYWVGLECPQTR